MKRILFFILVGTFACLLADAQKITSRKKFFTNEQIIEVSLTTNFGTLIGQKKDPVFQPATITWHNTDSLGDVTEPIRVRLRGNFRKDQCSFASMMFDFSDSTKKSKLNNLKALKIVVPCEWGSDDEQWVLREYLVYKIYQLFTDMSFRARLLKFKFDDNSGTFKPYKQFGFALEPIDDLAKRNGYKEVKEKRKVGTEETNRAHTTMVSIFQYMIGNTDWAVPPRHNIKLIDHKDSVAIGKPFLVPYDFDYCGAVNALYADPPPHIGIEKVTDRKYLGFPRTMQEIKDAIALFLKNEEAIYALIANFAPLKKAGKDELTLFIQDFYKEIKDEKNLQKIFIDNARTK
jgi:hypothetical protein